MKEYSISKSQTRGKKVTEEQDFQSFTSHLRVAKVAHVEECWSSKHETLSSSPRISKTKQNKTKTHTPFDE
jgi:hypothetical protein